MLSRPGLALCPRMWLELDYPVAFWGILEHVLLVIYSFELTVRVGFHGCNYFVHEDWTWHYLDFAIAAQQHRATAPSSTAEPHNTRSTCAQSKFREAEVMLGGSAPVQHSRQRQIYYSTKVSLSSG